MFNQGRGFGRVPTITSIMLLGINIKNVKQGETFRLKCDENAPLWVRDHYDRSSKKFCIHKYDDVNHFIMQKGTVTAYIEIY